MLNIIYTLFIFPIETLIDVLYLIYFEIFSNHIFTIIFLSITVNIIALPLYNIAEKWQEQERDIQKKLKSKLNDIKAVFRGNERHMLIKTYYRQNHYHPVYSLRSILGLFIQIPFFIAAYHYLGHLEILRGQSYGFIKDLSRPDGIILILGHKGINILPVIMTIINLCSVFVYSKKISRGESTRLYLMAVIFLALLYNAPSALVIYWTMNNILSFFKNIIYSSKHPAENFRLAGIVFLSVLTVFGILCNFKCFIQFAGINEIMSEDFKASTLLIAGSALIIAYYLITKFGAVVDRFMHGIFKPIAEDKKYRTWIFILSGFVLSIASGITAVSFLIASSPQEFAVNGTCPVNPAFFLFKSGLQAFAVFMAWPCIIYFLFSDRVKLYTAVLYGMASLSSIVNLFLFSGDYGIIYPRLIFENMNYLFPSIISGLLNVLSLIAVIGLFIIVIRLGFKRVLLYVSGIIIISLLAVSVCNAVVINRDYRELLRVLEKTDYGNDRSSDEFMPVFNLSKKGKNVFIIMLDRASGGYIEEIGKSSPEILKKMNGFVWYKNTIAYNGHTTMGMPAVFGGYEYTPVESNKRSDIPLVKKHNESLLVMPKIFSDAGYKVVFTDPTYANFNRIPDLRIFSGYKDMDALNLIGRYTQKWIKEKLKYIELPQEDIHKDITERYLLKFGIFRIIPNYFRYGFYDHGTWLSAKSDRFIRKKSREAGNIEKLLDNYSILDYMPQITSFNSESDTFSIMVNEIIHFCALLRPPEYMPGIDNNKKPGYAPSFKDEDSLKHFYTQIGAFRQICEWLDYLRENDVYDNTKIIIVSDHGHKVSDPLFRHFAYKWKGTYEYSWYQPLLMIKDFNSRAGFSVSNEFMTNADVPAAALKHLGMKKNPFTGGIINSDLKKEGALVVRSHNYRISKQGKYKYSFKDRDIVIVKDDIFIKQNWKKAEK